MKIKLLSIVISFVLAFGMYVVPAMAANDAYYETLKADQKKLLAGLEKALRQQDYNAAYSIQGSDAFRRIVDAIPDGANGKYFVYYPDGVTHVSVKRGYDNGVNTYHMDMFDGEDGVGTFIGSRYGGSRTYVMHIAPYSGGKANGHFVYWIIDPNDPKLYKIEGDLRDGKQYGLTTYTEGDKITRVDELGSGWNDWWPDWPAPSPESVFAPSSNPDNAANDGKNYLQLKSPSAWSFFGKYGTASDGVDFNTFIPKNAPERLLNGVSSFDYSTAAYIYFGTYNHMSETDIPAANQSATTYAPEKIKRDGTNKPILWSIDSYPENGRIKLVSMYVLDCQPFQSNVKFGNNYAESNIRNWLNSQFIANAFSSVEANVLASTDVETKLRDFDTGTEIINADSPRISHGDKVFLPDAYVEPARIMQRDGTWWSMTWTRSWTNKTLSASGDHAISQLLNSYGGATVTTNRAIAPVINLDYSLIIYASELSNKAVPGQTAADENNYRLLNESVGIFDASTYDGPPEIAWFMANLIYIPAKYYKLTLVNPSINLSSVQYNGISLANGSGIPVEFGGPLNLSGAGNGHNKLAYKIVQASKGAREIIRYGEGTATALKIDTAGLTAGGDYTLYVWAQKDNPINSNEGSAPMYFKLGSNEQLIPAPASASPASATVQVNGKAVAFDAYNINDNNYFKLRDLAYTLSGTEKQFEVGWDGANNAISLISGKPYTVSDGEMTGKNTGNKTAAPTTSKIFLDKKEVYITAYNIDGNNYFKLRDIGAAFDFGVDWDDARNTIIIDTSKGYTP